MKRIKRFFQKIGAWIVAHKVRFFLMAGILAATVILILDYLFLNTSNKADVIVEAHGMLFDIILFGIILTVYEAITDKRGRIERYQEELEDYKGWTGEEASFRVAGIVRRLLNEGVEDIDLSNLHVGQLVQIAGDKGKELIEKALRDRKVFCSLEGAALIGANLPGAILEGANLQGADLEYADLREAYLEDANLQGAKLRGANLQRAELVGTNLKGAYLRGAYLQRANLVGTNLKGADLREANLQGAALWETDLRGADLQEANLQGARLGIANLQGADLRGTNLEGADLGRAKLEGADLGKAKLEGAEAYRYQKEAFIITEEQLNSVKWLENPSWYKPKSEEQAPEAKQTCTATKKNGDPCTRNPREGYAKCTQHLKMDGELL